MNEKCYLAVDLGASSGRVFAGQLLNGKLHLDVLHRFDNSTEKRNGHLCWDYARLFEEIKRGMRKSSGLGLSPVSVGIDTWGVDFVPLGNDGGVIGDTVAYRDSRTDGMPEQVYRIVNKGELYDRTGIAEQVYNTVFQLMAISQKAPELLQKADRLLFAPEYLAYLLGGCAKNEYTIGSTSGLLRAGAHDWDYELLEALGIPARLFEKPTFPGTILGTLRPEVSAEVGFNCKVAFPASHDTASAALAVPSSNGQFVYLSSGTWSILGTELDAPITTEESRKAGFSNEGSYAGGVRFQRNIMGLWIIQSIRRELAAGGNAYGYGELSEMAEAADAYKGVIDVDDSALLAPESMIATVSACCVQAGYPSPVSAGELLIAVYRGLAACYAKSLRELERLTGRRFSALHLIGGGSQDRFLNRLTAAACGIPVLTGPVEATATGNILAQMLADGTLASVSEVRQVVRNSFAVETYP